MAKIEFKSGSYSWKEMTLQEYIDEGNIPMTWEPFFNRDDIKLLLKEISEKLASEETTIYPDLNNLFRAFIPLDKIKGVILGQDPYHNSSAVGYCFSVKPGNEINPSLLNIYKELERSGYSPVRNGILLSWVDQGMFMLNTALTVAAGIPESHVGIWYKFSLKVIQYISEERNDIFWLLMGAKAIAFEKHLPPSHFRIKTSHPSGFSATKPCGGNPAFIGSDIFKRTNEWLKKNGKKEIVW